MRKSISIWSFSPTLSLTDRLRLAREAGFDGFEVDLSDDGPLTPGSSAKEIAGVRTLAEKSGMQLSGLATGLYWGTNPASANSAVRFRADDVWPGAGGHEVCADLFEPYLEAAHD